MNKLLAGAVLFLGSVSAAQAQEVIGAGAAIPPATMGDSSTISDVRFTAIREAGDLAAYNAISAPSAPVSTAVSTSTDFATPLAVPSAALPGDPAAVPDPSPDPRFIYGGRDPAIRRRFPTPLPIRALSTADAMTIAGSWAWAPVGSVSALRFSTPAPWASTLPFRIT